MKSSVLPVLLIVGLFESGCIFHHRSHPAPAVAPAAPAQTAGPVAPAAAAAEPVVTPGSPDTGTVASYNETGRFVVMGFAVGHVPAAGQSLFLYRNGLKVAEIKITGPQRDNYTVGDVVTGSAQAGDEVRLQ